MSQEEEKKLLSSLNDFFNWLLEKNIVDQKFVFDQTFELPYADEDWIMVVDEKKGKVSFNTYISEKCSFEYYRIVVLHEFFHLVVQKVPNKEDATKIKDDFGGELMKLIDIEADYYIALYLKEKYNYSLVKYWAVNYEGGTIFIDKWIRTIKFERFIGTLLSTCNLFLTDVKKQHDFYELYLPTLNPIYTESSLHIIVLKKTHIYFTEIEAKYDDFVKLKECYCDVTNYSVKGYVKNLIEFSTNALKIDIPNSIKTELETL
jgi:hypothetical protein